MLPKSSGKSPSDGSNKDSFMLIHQEMSVHLSLKRAFLERHPAVQARRDMEMSTSLPLAKRQLGLLTCSII